MDYNYPPPGSAGVDAQSGSHLTGYDQQYPSHLPPAHQPSPSNDTSVSLPPRPAQDHRRTARPRQEIKRMYKCDWDGCEKAYGKLPYLNRHAMKSHGQQRRMRTLRPLPGHTAASSDGYNNSSDLVAATFAIDGDLEKMAENWTKDEWDNRRRIVVFEKSQNGSYIVASFRAMALDEWQPDSICISCIYWDDKQEYFVTSIDILNLLEKLVGAPAPFPDKEKDRIRMNLLWLHPVIVSSSKSDTKDFLELITEFGKPKPMKRKRPIGVYKWKDLAKALQKIVGQYGLPHSNTVALPSVPSLPVTSISLSDKYPQPLPSSANTATCPASAAGYIASAHHHADTYSSVQSMPSSDSDLGQYPTPNWNHSPDTILASPATFGYMAAPLPEVYGPYIL